MQALENGGLPAKHVLLLTSYHQSNPWDEQIYSAIKSVLKSGNRNVHLYVENMDTERLSFNKQYERVLFDLYKHKYTNGKIKHKLDLIISSDNTAFDFLRRYHAQLFPLVPVVFCGVNFFQDDQIADHPLFTGVAELFDAPETLDIALKFSPGIREVFVINDFLPAGKAWSATIAEDLKPYSSKLKINYAGDWTMEELLNRVRQLPDESIILLGTYSRDKTGHFYSSIESTSLITGAADVPVYGLLDFDLGFGIVGGKLISGYHQGEAAAKIGVRILDKEVSGQMLVMQKGTNRHMFDYLQLKRFNIPLEDLPQGSMIINEPYSFYREHKTTVWVVIAFIAMLILIIVVLLINIQIRKQSTKALKLAHDSLEIKVIERTSELQVAKEAAESARETIAEKNEQMKELLHILCHDLVHPFANLKAIIDLYEEEPVLMDSLLENIKVSIKNGLGTIDLVREMTSLEEKKKELELTDLNLLSAVQESLSILAHQIKNKNIDIRVNVPENLLVRAEETSFVNSVLNNLLSNAIKFSFHDSRIDISSSRKNGTAFLFIRDYGIGIPPVLIRDMFDISRTTTRQGTEGEKGTGFGMPLVKKFVTAYGGSLELSSEEQKENVTNHGTEVRLLLKTGHETG